VEISTVIDNLQERLKVGEKAVQDQEVLVERYESEIKKRNDSVKSKQNLIDRLNRKIEQLVGGRAAAEAEAEELKGPLEMAITSLEKELAAEYAVNEELQKKWIQGQTQVVSLTDAIEVEKQKVSELNARRTLLNQISIRLESTVEETLEDVKQYKSDINTLRLEMTKINRLIAHHRELKAKIENTISANEIAYAEELHQLKEQDLKLKEEVKSLQQQREETQNAIMECEKEALLWERKIQIEEETQKALDPSYGAAELKEMKKEVHRMELRLRQLKRKQEELVQEMELAVQKREVIHLRSMGKNKKQLTQNTLRKQIEQIKTQIKKATRETKKIDNRIGKLKMSLQESEPTIADKEKQLQELDRDYAILNDQLTLIQGQNVAMGEKVSILSKNCGEIEKCLTRPGRKSKTFGRKHLMEQQHLKEKYLVMLDNLADSIPEKQHYLLGIRSIFMEQEDG